jgi:hypothetical protein
MSFGSNLNDSIQSVVQKYLTRISNEYKIPLDELSKLWKNEEPKREAKVTFNMSENKSISHEPKAKPKTKAKPKVDEVSTREDGHTLTSLKKILKKGLIEMCKKEKLRHTGGKEELLCRLLGTVYVKKEKVNKNESREERRDVISKLIKSKKNTAIRKNAHNNYEHIATGLVFDRVSKEVYARQGDDGTLIGLTEDDIDECNRYKFQFRLPDNLDTVNLEDIKIEGMEGVEDEKEEDDGDEGDSEYEYVDEGDDDVE